jgi:hypothetical protein
MKTARWSKFLDAVQALLWAIFLIALPVTSFPFFPAELGGKTMVRPLSVYPLLGLLVLVTLPRLFKRPLPITFLPLLAFILAALASSILSLGYGLDVLFGVTLTARLLRNIITLAIGASIYLTVSLYPRSWEDLRSSLRWLFAGFAIALLWGSIQAIYVVQYHQAFFDLIERLQSFISTQRLFTTRVSGMTYEPKWFAEQISFVLLPWLLAAVIHNSTVFKWRYRRITIEAIMLAWAGGILAFTFSRAGLFLFVLLAFASILIWRARRSTPQSPSAARSQRSRWWILLEASLAALVLTAAIIAAGARNPYFSRLWTYWQDRPKNQTYLEYIAFSQRFAYVTTALSMFGDKPILGVGLGNYAFYFDDYLPNEPYYTTPEVVRLLTPGDKGIQLITPKNMLARLLAETGLVGTTLFLSFVIAVLGCVLYMWFAPLTQTSYWAVAGLLAMLAYMTVLFTSDSFAIPNIWVVFGFLTAAAHMPQTTAAKPELAPELVVAPANAG